MKVPEAAKVLFEAFPVTSFGPQVSNGEISCVSFRSRENGDEKLKVILCVNNLTQIEHRTIPTDPSSLSMCLHICQKNNLLLPDGRSGLSSHRLLPISPHGSPQGLPVLIETSGSEITRSITYFEAREFVGSKQKSAITLLRKSFLANLDHLWLLGLLIDADAKTLLRVYGAQAFGWLSDDAETLKRQLPVWRTLETKYPMAILWLSGKFKIETNYVQQLSDFEHFVPMVWNLKNSSDDDSELFSRFEIAAFVICSSELMPHNSHVRRLLSTEKFETIVKESYELLASF